VRPEDIELLERLYAEGGPFWLPLDAHEERELLDRMFDEFYDEHVETVMPSDYPEGEQVYVGRRGMSGVIALLRDSWTEWRFEAERIVDAGDRAVVLVRVIARGGASGLPSERETAHVWSARDGRLAAIQIFRERADALAAVGLGG
jgi:ketosteroid isomerase-like protein